MTDAALESLILDLLEWLASGPREHATVLERWRTSCPRMPVWEEANDRGFVERGDGVVRLSATGAAFLAERRPGVTAGRG